MNETHHMDWFILFSELLGGLTLLLFGMGRMSEAMKQIAGDSMKDLLATMSVTKVRGFMTGTAASAALQSSTVVSLLLVSFVSSSLLTFSQALPILLGAQIGSTIVNQIVAFPITQYSFYLVFIGYVLFTFTKSKMTQYHGHLLFGLGLMFFGNQTLTDSVLPLKEYKPLHTFLSSVDNSFVASILIGTVMTVVLQASSATISITSALAIQHFISLQTGIGMVLGANIGTCATSFIVSIGKPRVAMRLSIAYLIIKVIGAVAVIPFISLFTYFIISISPGGEMGIPRQIANSHTIFNILLSGLFLPLTDPFATWISNFYPERDSVSDSGGSLAQQV